MNEQQALAKMKAPGDRKPGKYLEGVIQIHVTRACDKSCYNCTQGSNLVGPYTFIKPENFRIACESLRDYFGVVGVFGGNPALHPQFIELCEILRETIPYERRGLWCNHPITRGKARAMRATFNPKVSNLNVHLDQKAYDLFKEEWPESKPFGLDRDSRHSPPFVAMKDVLTKYPNHNPFCTSCKSTLGTSRFCEECSDFNRNYRESFRAEIYDEEKAWELISECDINQHWSAMIAEFRGEPRAYFCEIAGAQAVLNQDNPDYPDTGLFLPRQYRIDGKEVAWWKLPIQCFDEQVRFHCHRCGVPLRGHGELAQSKDGVNQVSAEYRDLYRPKGNRRVEEVTQLVQLGEPLPKMTHYLQNSDL